MDAAYLDVARLLVQIAPTIFASDAFALKGGTAINLFVRDMPRLSVDLDLVLRDGNLARDAALAKIDAALSQAGQGLRAMGFAVNSRSTAGGTDTTLAVSREGVSVKVEVNHVMRGTIRPIRMASLVPTAGSTLKAELTAPILATDELYGSKLVAAMDRQHPRDLFDVSQLLAAEGLTPDIVEAFVAYLACHDRPIHEVLFPRVKDITNEYRETFVGMTANDIMLRELEDARSRMMKDLPERLTTGQRHFLSTLAHAEPDFKTLGLPHLEPLPAMQWKLINLRKLRDKNPPKFEDQASELDRKLGELA